MATKLDPMCVEGYSVPYDFETMYSVAISPDSGVELSVAQDHLSGLLLVFEGGASNSDVTIEAGNGIQGVEDLTFEVQSGRIVAICPETGRFKNMSGTRKGKIFIQTTAEGVRVSAYLLPLK